MNYHLSLTNAKRSHLEGAIADMIEFQTELQPDAYNFSSGATNFTVACC
ncbi:MAG: hypothetical protein IGS48_09850 [Oscillatoriales cyanobacterium C42_A2020_001]|nr:hypothetical protein [Leptolyngbyaceae cyanobacterium C42_A2020_001]